jgi:hypothetical protein
MIVARVELTRMLVVGACVHKRRKEAAREILVQFTKIPSQENARC